MKYANRTTLALIVTLGGLACSDDSTSSSDDEIGDSETSASGTAGESVDGTADTVSDTAETASDTTGTADSTTDATTGDGPLSSCDVAVEICDGIDNDCDDQIDEDLVSSCESACGAGSVTCVEGSWSACNAPAPSVESCNELDDDCDGEIDELLYPACVSGCNAGNGIVPGVTLEVEAGEVFAAPTMLTGSISDGDIDSWILEWSPTGENGFRPLAGGNSSVNGELGLLDTSLLPNGMTSLRLRTLDCDGNEVVVQREIFVEGANKVGDLALSFQDMLVRLGGISIELVRSYDSKRRAVAGDFGQGWDLEVGVQGKYARNVAIGQGWDVGCGVFPWDPKFADETIDHLLEVRLSPREFYRFKPVVTQIFTSQGICWGYLGFQQIGGRPGRLEVLGHSSLVFSQIQFDNLVWDDDLTEVDAPNVRLTTYDGRVYTLALGTGVTAVGDLWGNSLTISNTAITHSAGPSVSLARDGQGRITQITDPTGESLNYAYDAQGDLVSVIDRLGDETEFSYLYDHLLERWLDPAGRTPIRIEYDPDGRAGALVDGNQNPSFVDFDPLANFASVTSGAGQSFSSQFDAAGNLSELGYPDQSSTSYEYDASGNITQITDPLGNVTTQSYDARGNLASRTDSEGQVTTWNHTYDGQGFRTQTVEGRPDGTSQTVEYGAGERVTQVIGINGLVTNYQYDADGNPISETVSDGQVQTQRAFVNDALGRMTQLTDFDGSVTNFEYDALGQIGERSVTRTVDGQAVVETTTYTRDAGGRLTAVSDPLGNTRATVYDGSGFPAAVIDERGNSSSFHHDQNGKLVEAKLAPTADDPQGASRYYVYDENGQIAGYLDRDGGFTEYGYDDFGNPTQLVLPSGDLVEAGYDVLGRRTSMSVPAGGQLTWTYDGKGNPTSFVDGQGETWTRDFGPFDRLISQSDPLGNVIGFAYDQAGNRTQTNFPDGTSEQRSYDDRSRLRTVTNALGQITTYAYDARDRLASVSNGLAQATSFEHDELGNLVAITDAQATTTNLRYDGAGRVIARIWPSGAIATWAYDEAGNLTNFVDETGAATTWTYDAWNRPISKQEPEGTQVTWSWSAEGRSLGFTDERGTTSFSYDESGRMIERTEPTGESVSWTYDARSKVSSVTTPAGTTSYVWDDNARLESVADSEGEQTSYAWDERGRLISVSYGNGTSANYEYDELGRVLVAEQLDGQGMTLADYSYTYNSGGQRSTIEETTPTGTRTINYQYDGAGRLIGETIDDSEPRTISYTYDAVGNRLSRDDSLTGVTNYAYDEDDRLLSAGARSYEYDEAGRLIGWTEAGESASFEWNAANELVAASLPDGTEIGYRYDIDGLRVAAIVDGVETRYLWDSSRPDPELIAELDAQGQVLAAYTLGYERLTRRAGGETRWFHQDPLANVRALSDAAGVVTDAYDTDAFGRPLDGMGATVQPFGYRGQLDDRIAGLIYLRARIYDPDTGRFLSKDELPLDPWDPYNRHRYGYAWNDPVNFRDTNGYFAWTPLTLGAAGLAGIAAVVILPPTIAQILKWWRDKRPAYAGYEPPPVLGGQASTGYDSDIALFKAVGEQAKTDLLGAGRLRPHGTSNFSAGLLVLDRYTEDTSYSTFFPSSLTNNGVRTMVCGEVSGYVTKRILAHQDQIFGHWTLRKEQSSSLVPWLNHVWVTMTSNKTDHHLYVDVWAAGTNSGDLFPSSPLWGMTNNNQAAQYLVLGMCGTNSAGPCTP